MVVVVGDTLVFVRPVTVPTPLSMLRLVAPVVNQLSAVVLLAARFALLGRNVVITGAVPIVTVTVAVVDPNVFDAVSLYVVVTGGLTLFVVPETLPTP